MRCFWRLVYCVEYSVCPHYFISENNLFENKIKGRDRQILLNYLNILLSYGWKCILPALCLPRFQLSSNRNILYPANVNDFVRIIQSRNLLSLNNFYFNKSIRRRYARAVGNLSRYKSTRLKRVHLYYMSVLCRDISQAIQVTGRYGNKTPLNILCKNKLSI